MHIFQFSIRQSSLMLQECANFFYRFLSIEPSLSYYTWTIPLLSREFTNIRDQIPRFRVF